MSAHTPDCDVNDVNAEGIKKPCNCGAASELAAPAGSACRESKCNFCGGAADYGVENIYTGRTWTACGLCIQSHRLNYVPYMHHRLPNKDYPAAG